MLVCPKTLNELSCCVDCTDELEFAGWDILRDVWGAGSAIALWARVHGVDVPEFGACGDGVALQLIEPCAVAVGNRRYTDAVSIIPVSYCPHSLESEVEGEVNIIDIDFGTILLVFCHVEATSLEDLEES